MARQIARGSTAVFISPDVFRDGEDPLRWVPLVKKGTLVDLSGGWVFPKDDWARKHPIFDGLPSGGMLDYTVFREIVPDRAWAGLESPVEASGPILNSMVQAAKGPQRYLVSQI